MKTNNRQRHGRMLPLWVAVIAVIVVAILCVGITVVLMKQYRTTADSELASEVGSFEAVTENVIPQDSTFVGLQDSPHWQLRTFDWLLETPVKAADLAQLSESDRALLANAILAMAGYDFPNRATRKLFEDFEWYHPWVKTLEMLQLSDVARDNYTFIMDYKR